MMQDGLNSNDNWNTNASMQVVVLKSSMRNTLPKLARVAVKLTATVRKVEQVWQ